MAAILSKPQYVQVYNIGGATSLSAILVSYHIFW